MIEDTAVDRRSFLTIATWTIGGLISLGIGIPAVAYIIGPAIKGDKTQSWIRLGSISKIVLSTPTLFRTSVERQTGWIVNKEEGTVYVLK